VLDWANTQSGDPRADAARTISILRLSPIRPGMVPGKVVQMRRLIERGWRHGYQELGGTLTDMALFYAWAGAVMVRDLAPRAGQPGTGVEARHMDRIRRWTDYWKAHVGIE